MKYCLVSLAVPLYKSTYTYEYDEESVPDPLYKRVEVEFGKAKKTGFCLDADAGRPEGDFEIKKVIREIDKEPVIDGELVKLAEKMSFLYKSSLGMCLSLMVPNAKRETETAPFTSEESFSRISELTEDQSAALEKYRRLLAEGKKLFYLYGVTGSGKSEVFLRAAEDQIRNGRQVLYLVPEITLTEQLSGDVYDRFGGRVVILHSALTPSQRLKNARRIKNGEIDLVIGARSAVFAPFKDLGLIIMDEEHETTYKSGNNPRYHARQVAQMRSEIAGCPFIMGSATPSFEAWRMMKEGRVVRLSLPRRIGAAAFPTVRIVDTVGQKGAISRILKDEIDKEIAAHHGVILFLNRRGYSTAVTCNTCGEPIKCPNCSIPLSLHKRKGRLVCHTCGWSGRIPDICPECHSHDLSAKGFGTEQIEDEIRKLFPFARVARLDTDTVSGKREVVQDILHNFSEGNIDILLGTQMIAKGLNFPLATLVGVINADSTLYMPDFRAAERTFDLLYQVSGRVGRYKADGKVIIQTSQVYSSAIRAIEANDAESFYADELELRRSMGYPPYGRLLNVTLRGRDYDRTEAEAKRAEEALEALTGSIEGVEMYGQTECLIEKKATWHRRHILFRTDDRAFYRLLVALEDFVSSWKSASGVHLDIDSDPQDMM